MVKQLEANTFLFPFADINWAGGYRSRHLLTTANRHSSSMKETCPEERAILSLLGFFYYHYIMTQTAHKKLITSAFYFPHTISKINRQLDRTGVIETNHGREPTRVIIFHLVHFSGCACEAIIGEFPSSLKWHKQKKIYALKGQCQKQVYASGCLERKKKRN